MPLNTTTEPYFKKAFWVSAALMLLTMLWVCKDYGITGDETHLNAYNRAVVSWYATGGKDTTCLNLPIFHDKDRVLKYYGAGFELAAALAKKVLPVEEYHARRITNALFGFAAIVFTGLIAMRLGGWRMALIALWIIFLSPRFFGHSMNNPKDIPFAATSAFAVWAMMIYFDNLKKLNYKHVLLAGLAIASAINIRFGGLLLFGYFGLFLLVEIIYAENGIGKILSNPFEKIKPYFLPGATTIAIGYFCGLIFWPFGLLNPAKHPFEPLKKFGNLDVSLRQVFEGEFIMSSDLPWYYLPKMIAITTPYAFISGFILAVALFWFVRKQFNQRRAAFVLFAAMFPVMYIIYTNANIFHEWRHTYFAYPPLVVIAALGWESLFRIIKTKVPQYAVVAVFGVILLLPLGWFVKAHPHQYLYYNQFVGGLENAKGNYVMDYWMNSMKEAYEWTVANAEMPEGRPLMIATTAHPQMIVYNEGKEDKYDVQYARYYQRYEKDWDYGLFYADFISPSQLRNPLTWPPDGTVHVIKAGDVAIGAVIKRTDKSDYKGFLAMNEGNIPEAIRNFEQALKFYPNSEIINTSLGIAYLNAGKMNEGINSLVRGIQLYPENAQAYFYLGYAYAIQGNRNNAAIYLQKAVNLNPGYGQQAQEIMSKVR